MGKDIYHISAAPTTIAGCNQLKTKLVTLSLVALFSLLSFFPLTPNYAATAKCTPHPTTGVNPRSQTVHTSITVTASIEFCNSHTKSITVKIDEFLPNGMMIKITGQPATGTFTFSVSVHGTYKVEFYWYNSQLGHQPLTKTAFVTSET
jgi:hypothetical protein